MTAYIRRRVASRPCLCRLPAQAARSPGAPGLKQGLIRHGHGDFAVGQVLPIATGPLKPRRVVGLGLESGTHATLMLALASCVGPAFRQWHGTRGRARFSGG